MDSHGNMPSLKMQPLRIQLHLNPKILSIVDGIQIMQKDQ